MTPGGRTNILERRDLMKIERFAPLSNPSRLDVSATSEANKPLVDNGARIHAARRVRRRSAMASTLPNGILTWQ